ncbi:MAG TPA: response regulator [Acidimicrobiales bacterium]|jgi:CheY-like chemotaxis protein
MARVLVVDDEPDIRLIARVVLTSAGYEVVEAASADEALASLAERRPDLLLLDVRMPGRDGWSVLEQVRTEQGDLPVVIFTADIRARRDAPKEGRDTDHILLKPFGPDDLLAAVSGAIGDGAKPGGAATPS